MTKEEKAKAESEAKAKTDTLDEYRELNKDLDMFSRASSLTLKLPTGPDRLFIAKANLFRIDSRLGSGPCTVIKKFMLPNGDLIIAGDTFDPVVERMSPGLYSSLKSRKFFSLADKKYEPKFK